MVYHITGSLSQDWLIYKDMEYHYMVIQYKKYKTSSEVNFTKLICIHKSSTDIVLCPKSANVRGQDPYQAIGQDPYQAI